MAEEIQTIEDFNRQIKLHVAPYKWLSASMFEKNGIFSNIKMPLTKRDKIPEEILEYIYGEDYKTHLKINYPALKLRLNELAGKRASF
jgi:hypothetical protein